jgi:hypothetical protein
MQATMDRVHVLGIIGKEITAKGMLKPHLTISGARPEMLPVALNTEVRTLLDNIVFTAFGMMMWLALAPAIPASLGVLRRNFHSVLTTPYMRA